MTSEGVGSMSPFRPLTDELFPDFAIPAANCLFQSVMARSTFLNQSVLLLTLTTTLLALAAAAAPRKLVDLLLQIVHLLVYLVDLGFRRDVHPGAIPLQDAVTPALHLKIA